MRDSYEFLNQMLIDFKRELSDLNAQIQRNLLYIKEAQVSARSLEDSVSDDYRIFSPRSMSEQQREEIEKAYSRKSHYEQQNNELYISRENLEKKIEYLEKILKQEKNSLTVLHVQEEDRQRISRELHDTSLQNLAYLIHKIELCNLYIDEDPTKAKLELSVVSSKMKEVIAEIRKIIFHLRPMNFDDLGFKAALERFLANVNEDRQYEMDVDIDDISCENNFILLNVYRLIQEGIVNICKHAEAEKIIFHCKMSGNQCIVDIADDGKGFYVADVIKDDRHFGLSLMKERAEILNGTISISSSDKDGTKIHIEIPLGK